MAEFWRVQSALSKLGPYQCSWHGADALASAHDSMSSRRPIPWEEPELREAFEAGDTASGSASAPALAWWFEGWWSQLAVSGQFVVLAYDHVNPACSSRTGQAVMPFTVTRLRPTLVMSVPEFVAAYVN
jgi:hypothetical protein